MKALIDQLGRLAEINIYPVISLLIFLAFFLMVGIRVLRASREYIDEMSRLPLDQDNQDIET